jgi:hypothetical protein
MSNIFNKPEKKKGQALLLFIIGCLFVFGCIPLFSLHLYAAVASLGMGLISLLACILSLKKVMNKGYLEKALAELPENYYFIQNADIGATNIDYIAICPKGIFNVENDAFSSPSNHSPIPGQDKYLPVKHSILKSKGMNDFMQKCRIGNYFVNTLHITNFEDDKLKTYFPEIPIIKPEEIKTFFESLPDKYSDEQCKKVVDLLELNLRIDKNLKQLREEKTADVTQDRSLNKIKH